MNQWYNFRTDETYLTAIRNKTRVGVYEYLYISSAAAVSRAHSSLTVNLCQK
jgi:hypothetical protein